MDPLRDGETDNLNEIISRLAAVAQMVEQTSDDLANDVRLQLVHSMTSLAALNKSSET